MDGRLWSNINVWNPILTIFQIRQNFQWLNKNKSRFLTPIRYISGISRSVISGKKIQNLLFSPWWRHTGPIFYDVICIHYYISYPNYRSHELNHVTSSVLDITWWTGLLKKIRENPSFLQKYPFRNISIIFMSISERTLTHFPKSIFFNLNCHHVKHQTRLQWFILS